MSNDQFFSFNIGSTENVFNAKELTVFCDNNPHIHTQRIDTFPTWETFFGTTATCNIFKEKKRNALILDSK